MDRRGLLKTVALTAAAAILVPSCVTDTKKVSIALNNLKVTSDEEELLALIASTLIPETDTPGGSEVGAHLYAFVMIDDCSTEEQKSMFMEGLQRFDRYCKKTHGERFSEATIEQRNGMLSAFEDKKSQEAAITDFYFVAKNLIIDGYKHSRHFLTEVKPYQLIPGPNFNGCAKHD